MKLDRAVFLSLTAGLFAAACAASHKEQPPSDSVAIPPQPPAPPRSAEAAVETPPREARDAGRAVADEPAPTPPATALPRCDTDGPEAEACNGLSLPGPTCEHGLALKEDCERLRRLLRPDVAGSVVQCMQTKHASCTFFSFGESACVKRAMGQSACVVPEAEAACQQVFERCSTKKRRTTDPRNTVDVEVCRAAYSAVRTASRPRFVTCMLESCIPEACFHVDAKDPPPSPGPRRPAAPALPRVAWSGSADTMPPAFKTCKLATDCVLSTACCTTMATNWAGVEDAQAVVAAQTKKSPCNRTCVAPSTSPACVGGQCVVR